MTQRNVCVFLSGCFCGAVVVGVVASITFPLFEINLNGEVVVGSTEDLPTSTKLATYYQETENVDYAMNGYCPVTLQEDMKWKLGNRDLAETRDGQTFLFADPEHQKRFREQPSRYMPFFSGNDLVLAMEEGRVVKGNRRHGINLKGRILLFASEDSLRKFGDDPYWYLSHAIDQYKEMNEEPVVRSEHESLDPESDYALDGYCPVTLVEDSRWKQGDRDFAETRDGQMFLFAKADHQKRFREQPDRYMPVFFGNDVVLAREEGRIVRGKRRHGVFFRSQIFLFASEDSLRQFNQVPYVYSRPADGNQEEKAVVPPGVESADLDFNVHYLE